MNHEILKKVIADQHEVIRNAEIVPRPYNFDPRGNYVLTGLRRAGKSTLLYGMVRELIRQGAEWNRIIFINFEDERLTGFGPEDFDDIVSVQSELSREKGFFFFDEIQNIDGWHKFARRMADAGEYVQITGSNARMLSRDVATTLGGRYLIRTVRPYRFDEYLKARGVGAGDTGLTGTKAEGEVRCAAEEYLRFGGLPESLRYRDKREYISGVYQKVLLNDIAMRNQIRNDLALRLLMKKVAETVTNEVSYSTLAGSIKAVGGKIAKDTLIDYMDHAESAYLIFKVKNWFSRFAERESAGKYYFGDNGFLTLHLSDKEPKLLENAVAVELTARYGEEVYYLKSPRTGIDVDFYLPAVKTAVQVTWTMDDRSEEREIRSLVKLAASNTEAERFVIVTHEQEGMIRAEGIEIEMIPAYRFLAAE